MFSQLREPISTGMIRLWLVLTLLVPFQTAIPVYAQDAIINPALKADLGGDPDGQAVIGRLLARFFASALAVAAIMFLLYLVVGAYKWLTAGADKGQLQSAQSTMTQALIGLTILASIFAAARIIGTLLGLSCPEGSFPDVICWPGIS